ncbi:CPBP family intramembrane glutamic endopeptidase [Arsenicicoccus dermatophilus]|uniref:CPBP family intramembrane glutamic endopeptidase n=1 Tax=Arsenicicoccus dermatophilus TaxID=1076331 RepID=UPI001F4C8E6A|nr:type II CAAX endopeptidase family protein [Arsenicicoccus dermatophilus]MCH8614330.1 CPBP family intramembrane metalloprotease [Arsenicicoccus dermatophilus]
MPIPAEQQDQQAEPVQAHPRPERREHLTEVLLLLGLSLGSSAIYAVLSLTERLTRHVALDKQTSHLNSSVTPDRPWLDLAYQLAGIGLGVVAPAMAVFLLRHRRPPADPRIGVDRSQPLRDLARGAGLAALIGIPGLALYLVGRQLGITTQVAAANLGQTWWAVPVLCLSALQNAVLEEVVVVAYLLTRLRQAGMSDRAALAVSAVLRGSYHLYQGIGPFFGNLVMGVVFGLAYRRWGRVLPLVVAHTILDVVAFVGYALLRGHVGWL